MRRIIALLGVGVVAGLAPAHAAPVVIVEGTIQIGNPLAERVGGISEILNDCGDDHSHDGIDGITFDVPNAARTRPGTLTTNPSSANANVYWYDVNCHPISDAGFDGPTGNESGTIPVAARSGVVNLLSGLDADVRLTYVPQPD